MKSRRYLYIDKKQRVQTEGELPKRVQRILEELQNSGYDHDFIYSDDLKFLFKDGQLLINAGGKDLREYTHVLFGGHYSRRDYELKQVIVGYADLQNSIDPENKIYVQNSEFMKKMTYYSKIWMAKICIDHNLPHLDSYYSASGDYKSIDPIEYPLITKHFIGENDLVEIDNKIKVKKTVFKVENEDEWSQERLAKKDLKEYFVQEFTDVGEDIRTFVSNGKVVGGWKRVANDGFMTVTKGSTYIFYNEPDSEIKEICERAAKAWDVDFMALDFIYKNGKPYILEFSMHPGFNAYENKCIEGEPNNIAKSIIESFPDTQ
jgi:hypothetical protein